MKNINKLIKEKKAELEKAAAEAKKIPGARVNDGERSENAEEQSVNTEERPKESQGDEPEERPKESKDGEEAPGEVKKRGGKEKYIRPEGTPKIFSDVDTSKLTGKNKRFIVLARKTKTRGKAWDVIENHAGMTEEWILSVNPKAKVKEFEEWAIKPGDGIATVEILQHTMDRNKLIAKRLSDGNAVVVFVRDSSDFRDGEQVDVEERGGKYFWREELNR